MVRRYDVISGRWSSHFCVWVKIHVFFPFLSTIKVNYAKCLFMSYFSRKAQKITTCRHGGFKKIKGFQKSFRNTATYQKLWGEVPSITRFPLLKCTAVGGYEFVCTSEGWYVFKVEFIIGDTCTVLSGELFIESTLGKTVSRYWIPH